MSVHKFLLSFALLFSCVTFCFASVSDKALEVYTEDKLGISVTEDTAQFVIKLKSNPTTGYSWFLREYDERLIEPIERVFQVNKNKLVGEPGFELWTFHVKRAGFIVPQQTIIRFVYARPWEGTDQFKQIVFRVTTLEDQE